MELRNTAYRKKKDLKNESYIIEANGKKYFLKIGGVGRETIRLNVFLSYDEILDNKDTGLEELVYKDIVKLR